MLHCVSFVLLWCLILCCLQHLAPPRLELDIMQGVVIPADCVPASLFPGLTQAYLLLYKYLVWDILLEHFVEHVILFLLATSLSIALTLLLRLDVLVFIFIIYFRDVS